MESIFIKSNGVAKMFKINRLLAAAIIMGCLNFTMFAQKESDKIQKLAREADVILAGKVINKESRWNEARTSIYTKTTLQVDEYLKGQTSKKSIEIRYPGGEVGEIGEIYSHMPKFENNEEVLLFLKLDQKNNGYKVLHGEEGKFTVINDEVTKEKITSSKMPFNSLKEQIKSIIKEN
jgi:hypothetical protein